MGFSEAIQNARKNAGITQEQLAAKVFVTRQAVSRWETGESEPSIDMRKLLEHQQGQMPTVRRTPTTVGGAIETASSPQAASTRSSSGMSRS